MDNVQIEGSRVQEAKETISFIGAFEEYKIDKELLWRKVPIIAGEQRPFFPPGLNLTTESFEAFLLWINEDKLPVLHVLYNEKDGSLKYYGYDHEMLYRAALWFNMKVLANHIMDCIRKVHVSFGVGFTKIEITRIYAQQVPHWGLSYYAALWIYLEDTRPNDYMKATTKTERVALLENETIAQDVRHHAHPWFLGSQSACVFHIHNLNQPCLRNYDIAVGLWVIDKNGEGMDLNEWRIKKLAESTPTEGRSNL
ncbi:hypothetical protein BOTCAL_0029g00010 [Botryotinia calthae]|uniref:Uncharacterized protein n=1 Tax=Botryotinia calthae TaxID=38488 RepID=A0A4Y8DDH4_9HELO|nr:hypothetical protein BOTCAL_0029g00010 [Botryotinia calthae]